jgi:hypothetical protein
MRNYSDVISLTKNSRGIYSLDTTMGCKSGLTENPLGCYGDCYAAKSAKLYGYDFGETVVRRFRNEAHKKTIVRQISNIPLGFVRIGTSGDPSEAWEHTLNVCKDITPSNKEIVIITKHWLNLADTQLKSLEKLNVCINTSVSALDSPKLLSNSIEQYLRLRPYCKSILRIVSCDFNTENQEGKRLSEIQHQLFKNESIIDTVFRVNKKNKLVKDGVINISESTFLGKKCYISKFRKSTYFGKCATCHEMCGLNIKSPESGSENRRGVVVQQKLFKSKP